MKVIKKIFIILLTVILYVVAIIGAYFTYLEINYYRIDDNTIEEIINNSNDSINLNTSYSISTYNIGFGAYSKEYSFFMDNGVMKDGTKVKGKYSKAFNKESVTTNTKGSIDCIKALNADFMLFQEVDVDASRSYRINQRDEIKNAFSSFSSTFSTNFHTKYLPYPINDPHGFATSGILTLSKFNISSSIRRSLPISNNLIDKLFDLDRCLNVTRYTLENDKELVIINAHLSAYDKGGVYRKLQLEMLNNIFTEERDLGNYVICGGDFNHDIADSLNYYETMQEIPSWVYSLTNEDLPDGYSIQSSKNAPTCRSTDMAYKKDANYTVVVDGFITSNNINITNINNIDLDFTYSDHNPVQMTFELA